MAKAIRKKPRNQSGTQYIYRGKLIYVDWDNLKDLIEKFCKTKKVSHQFNDFNSWSVADTLKRIRRGNELYKTDPSNKRYCKKPWLNKIKWLYSNYINETYGLKAFLKEQKNPSKKKYKSKKSDKWLAATKTVHGLDTVVLANLCPDPSLNAEEAMIAREEQAEKIEKIKCHLKMVTDPKEMKVVLKLLKNERENYETI